MQEIILIVHDIRSCHNVGSLLRTAEGIGVDAVYFSGYTPYPHMPGDARLPHISAKLTAQIQKTALVAEVSQKWKNVESVDSLLKDLSARGFTIAALEQTPASIELHSYTPPEKVALLLGREVEGIDPEILKHADVVVEIPMHGSKESFNVVQAAAMALFHLRFH